MSGQGAYGPDGPKGPSGIDGRKGLQGDGRGPTGANLYSGGLLNVLSTVTGSTINVNAPSGSYYPINLSVGNAVTLNMPNVVTPIGTFWVFKNLKTNTTLRLSFSNGRIKNNGQITFNAITRIIAADSTILVASLGTTDLGSGDEEYVVF
jgi:hypothetical protein